MGPCACSRISSAKPMTAFSGVRNSWLMLARNLDLALLARSASTVAAVSSEVRAVMVSAASVRAWATRSRSLVAMAPCNSGRTPRLMASAALASVSVDAAIRREIHRAAATASPIAISPPATDRIRCCNGTARMPLFGCATSTV